MGRIDESHKKASAKSNKMQKDIAEALSIDKLLLADYVMLCEDFIQGRDGGISIIKTIDMLNPSEIPFTPTKFILVASFYRFQNILAADYAKQNLEFRLTVMTPSGREANIGPLRLENAGSGTSNSLVERIIVDLSNSIEFTQSGLYTFKLEGKTKDSQYKVMCWKGLPIGRPKVAQRRITQL